MNLEEKFKKETSFDAYADNDLRPKVPSDYYVEWLEEQLALCNVPRWVACKDEMPKNTNRIITFDGMFVQEGHYSFITRKIEIPSFKHHNKITHWMPLPKPPC